MNATSETIETLKQLLDSEEQSETITRIPRDTYPKIAAYVQKLRKGADMGSDDPSSRLAKRELWIIEGMGRQLLNKRLSKAISQHEAKDLLPEERYLHELHLEFERMSEKFASAMANGQPSVFTLLQKNQMEKMVTVSFQRPLGEIIGFDLRRYGPFEVHDVATLPSANADALVSSGDARIVYTSDSI
jgi:DNA replication initiation complex subunit (GINS family)